MKGLNLSQFKKIKEDANTVTMGHPNGHSITIAKGKLPALQLKQLEKLPIHMDEGGGAQSPQDVLAQANAVPTTTYQQTIPNESTNEPQAPAPIAANDDIGFALQSQPNKPADLPISPEPGVPLGTDEKAASELPEASKELPDAGKPVGNPAQASSSGVNPIVQAQMTGGVDFGGAYNQGQRAISENEQVAEKMAAARLQVGQDDLAARKKLQEDQQKSLQDIQEHRQQALSDYASGHINPKHYQENMGTGQKVATAIGLLLGGFTGGFNKTNVNPAAQWLNDQINKDIEAQKSNMDKQKNVLSAYQDLYHDNILATNATRATLNDIYDHQIQTEAARLGTPAAKAAADAAHAQFAFQNGQLVQSMAIRNAVLGSIKTNGGKGVTPLQLGQAGFMSPEQAQKEQASIDGQNANIQTMSHAFDELYKLQTVANKLSSPIQTGQQIAAIKAKLYSIIQDADPSKRLTPETAKKEIEPYLVGLTASPKTFAVQKQAGLEHLKVKYAGQTPVTSQYAPAALPNYNVLPAGNQEAPQYKVGQVIYVNGQKNQIVNAQGDFRPVK